MIREVTTIASFDEKLMYFLLMRSFFKKTIYQGKSFRIKVGGITKFPTTAAKGPFAHKKSKEQFAVR